MRTILLKKGDDEQIWACNDEREGLFVLSESGGSWDQIVGTCDTPIFETPSHLRRWMGRQGYARGYRLVERSGYPYDWD